MKALALLIILLDARNPHQSISVTELPDMETCLTAKAAIIQSFQQSHDTDVWFSSPVKEEEIRCVEVRK